MRLELVVLFVVAFVAVVGLMQANFSGMVVAEPALASYPQMFGPGFDAVVIKGSTRSPEEITASNLIIARLASQYELLHQELYATGVDFSEDLQYKILTHDKIDYRTTDAVLIGSICHNSAIAKLLGVIDCMHYFQPGEGMVKYIESGGRKYVVITGYSGEEVLAAAVNFLSDLQLNKIESNELRIDSIAEVPLRDPMWYGAYTTNPTYRDTRKNKVFVLGEWMDLR